MRITITKKERDLLVQACEEMKMQLEESAADEPVPFIATFQDIEADKYQRIIKRLKNESN